ncbi:Gfo/Idh/MocA family protein [Geochorda subterranea]|uniref:Gfo/Idh/MocA family oxidoreductase n=1 Tax=Geochorda subterranea TaxID=3109564 RepID=A0ABZ1BSK0_9FIRM|nr:Gfo/Idh/MocA family oxidoreductase [Limnochorda sp. LNt]WRP15127.1 Gfo/Idh/MocA family oxidoreductase [Limnochorda sp. LNt]
MSGDAKRVMVVGAGIMGGMHARAVASRGDLRLVAVVDSLPGAAEALAGRLGAAWYTDVGDAIDAQRPQVVVLATPDWAHRGPFEACLRGDVETIIVEKPLATTVEDAEAMVRAAASKGVMVLVNYSNRCDPLLVATRWAVEAGLVGDPVYLDLRLDDDVSVPRGLWGGRSREWAARSSPLHFLLPHLVDLAAWLLGGVRLHVRAASATSRVLPDSLDLVEILGSTPAGTAVRLKSEWVRHSSSLVEFDISITGSRGTVVYRKLSGPLAQPGWCLVVEPSEPDPALDAFIQRVVANWRASVCVSRSSRTDPDRRMSWVQVAIGPTSGPPGFAYLLDAAVERTPVPARWKALGAGPLPTGEEALACVRVLAEAGRLLRPAAGREGPARREAEG